MRKTVTLNPGESKVVAFTTTPTVAKTYAVTVDGLTGYFSAIEVPVAEFTVTNLTINPTQVYVGETVNISVTVTNVGNIAGSYEVNCEVF